MAYSYECRLWKIILYSISFKTDVVAPTVLVLTQEATHTFSLWGCRRRALETGKNEAQIQVNFLIPDLFKAGWLKAQKHSGQISFSSGCKKKKQKTKKAKKTEGLSLTKPGQPYTFPSRLRVKLKGERRRKELPNVESEPVVIWIASAGELGAACV